MDNYIIYAVITILLLAAELVYFRIADKFNIVDRPNERSSHSRIVRRGGGVIFTVAVWIWSAFYGFEYPWFLAAVTLASGVSFIDDIHSLPDGVRFAVQIVSILLLFFQIGLFHADMWLIAFIALFVCLAAVNFFNFMDGINGITTGYSMAVLVPLILVNEEICFVEDSFLVVVALSVAVFGFFNFRGKGKSLCFAGDVGSVGIAVVLLFFIGLLSVRTADVTWLLFLIVYGVDGAMTICHRILLHEKLGVAHRKHAFQIMANELKLPHPLVSSLYLATQLLISLGFIYLCPALAGLTGCSLLLCHWLYLFVILVLLILAYLVFMKKYYHLHEEYLASLRGRF